MMKYKLNQLGDFKNGANYPKDSYVKGDKIVNVKDLFRGRFVDESSLDELKPRVLKDKSIYQTEDGDILFTRSSLVRSGAGMCAMVHNPSQCILFCGFIIRYRLFDKTSVYPLYLLYLLRSPQYRNLFTGNQQTNITNINQDSLGDIDVYLPVDKNGNIDYAEQVKLVSILDALDEKIALNKKMNQKLEAMAKRLYDYWFVQFDFPDKNGRPYKSSGGGMVWNEELKREIPEDWEVKSLADISQMYQPKTFDAKLLEKNGAYRVYGAGGYMGQYHEYNHEFSEIIISCRGSCGNIYKTQPFSLITSNAMIVHPNDIQLREYLYWTLVRMGVQHCIIGTVQPQITRGALAQYKLIFPSTKSIKDFNKYAAAIDQKTRQLTDETQKLTALRDKLLPLLMNGQVVVK